MNYEHKITLFLQLIFILILFNCSNIGVDSDIKDIKPEPTVCVTEKPTKVPVVVEPTLNVEPTTTPTISVKDEPIDKEDLELLAHLIFAEAGSDWCKDEMLYGVGSVVLNRIASEYYPNNMYDVIYQRGQYACTWNGHIKKEPNERAYRIAEDLLRNGSTLPENVLFQAQFKQGDGVYVKIQNMYFCYLD